MTAWKTVSYKDDTFGYLEHAWIYGFVSYLILVEHEWYIAREVIGWIFAGLALAWIGLAVSNVFLRRAYKKLGIHHD